MAAVPQQLRNGMRVRTRVGLLVVLAAGCLASTPAARADETVVACIGQPNAVFVGRSATGITAGDNCGNGGGLDLTATGQTTQGTSAAWQATAPAGLAIVGANVDSMGSRQVNAGTQGQYGGGFTWGGGGGQQITPNESSAALSFPASATFGFFMVCGKSPCTETTSYIYIYGVSLQVRETSAPTLHPGVPTNLPGGLPYAADLWNAPGWARGDWTVSAGGNSPSGICSLSASLAGQELAGASAVSQSSSDWYQCSGALLYDPVNTVAFPNGDDKLVVEGTDAAGLSTGGQYTKTVEIDNEQPTVSFSGPSDAPSTAGTQYVTAIGGAGPSGVSGLSCSVDGATAQWFAASSARVPVGGVGTHHVQCFSQNSAKDPNGTPGQSATQTFTIKIGQPTILGAAFQRLAGLRCHTVRIRRTVRGRTVTRRRHGRRITVETRPHVKIVKVLRCHVRTVRRRTVVYVPVRRHGRTVRVKRARYIRVVVAPHVISHSKKRVGFGRGTTVSGFLGLADGTALPGRVVRVLTSPANGLGRFSQAAAVTTAADGTWTAKLPAGPSRIVQAVYDGDPTTESTSSGQVQVLVSAKIKLRSAVPQRVPWGGTVRITGRLLGGYLPAGGVNLRLRIGIGPNRATYGIREHVAGRGRFSTKYTFGAGYPAVYRRYWFQIATLPSGNYPYTPTASNRVYVLVGGNPPTRLPTRRGSQPKRNW